MNSIVLGIMPLLTISETVSAAVSILLKTAIIALTVSGNGRSRSVMRVIIPRVPSEPTNNRVKSYPTTPLAV